MCSQMCSSCKPRNSEGQVSGGLGREGGHLADSSAPSAAGLALILQDAESWAPALAPGPCPSPTARLGKPRPRPSFLIPPPYRHQPCPSPNPLLRPYNPSSASIVRLRTSNHLLLRAGPAQETVWFPAPPTPALGPPPWKALPVRLGLSVKIRMVVGFHGVWQSKCKCLG